MDKHFAWLWEQLEKAATDGTALVDVVDSGVVLARAEMDWLDRTACQRRKAAEREEEARLASETGAVLGLDEVAQ